MNANTDMHCIDETQIQMELEESIIEHKRISEFDGPIVSVIGTLSAPIHAVQTDETPVYTKNKIGPSC